MKHEQQHTSNIPPTIHELRRGDYCVIASVSGGKDSTAVSLWLEEQGIEHERVVADTQWESRLLYDHVLDYLPGKLGRIETVGYPGGMTALIQSKQMFPSRMKRFCTQFLKVFPLRDYARQREAETGKPAVQVVGIRREESKARADAPEWEWVQFSADWGCWKWGPMVEVTRAQVIELHAHHGVLPCRLYLEGAERVGCWPCIFAGKRDLRLLARIDPGRVDAIEALEQEIAAGQRARTEARGETAWFDAAWFQGHAANVTCADGEMRYPTVPIRQAVEWAKTSRGGKEYELFWNVRPRAECTRWGLCGI